MKKLFILTFVVLSGVVFANAQVPVKKEGSKSVKTESKAVDHDANHEKSKTKTVSDDATQPKKTTSSDKKATSSDKKGSSLDKKYSSPDKKQ